MNTSLIRKSLLTLLLFLPLTAAAVIYKWVDEDGNINYSEAPPPNIAATRLKAPPPPPVDPDQAMQALRDRAKAFDERRENRHKSAEELAENKQTAEKKQQRCAQLKKNLDTLNAHTRIQKQNEKGEYVALDDQQRLNSIEETKKRIKEEC